MDPKFDGFYARGRAMLNDPARKQEIIGAADFATAKQRFKDNNYPFIKMMSDAGIRVVTGTDCGAEASQTTPVGHTTHRKCTMFVEAGMTPAARAARGDARCRACARADRKSQLRIDPGRQDRRSGRAECRSDCRHQQHHQDRSRHEGGKMGSITVRPDIYEKHQSLFGDKTVNGRRVNVEELIAQLTRDTKHEFRTLLSARHVFQDQVGRRERSYGFLAPDTKISDADGNTATVRDIRQGMLDGFFGRKTPQAWRLNPVGADSEGHDEAGSRRHRPGDRSRHGDGRAQHRRGVVDVGLGRRRRRLQGSALPGVGEPSRSARALSGTASRYVHPTKKQGGKPRQYTIDLPPEKWPTIFHRVPGLHLENRQISLDGEQVPAMIPALVMHAVSNYDTQKKNGSGVYYYVPKVETWQEARLVSRLLKRVEEALGLAARFAEDQDAERARRVRAAAGSHHVGAAREPHRAERRPMGLSEQPRRDVPARSADGDPRSEHRDDDRAVADVLHDAQRAAGAARRRHADRRHGGADAESAGARERCRRRCATSGSTSCASG